MAATSEILSQDEIDALLNGVNGNDADSNVDIDSDFDESGVRSYDFLSKDRLTRSRLPALEMINERFARNFRGSIYNILRRPVGVLVDGVQITKFGDYIRSLFMPSNLNIVKIHPLRGSALVVMNPRLVYTMVDNFFGGTGRFHTKIEGRDFTPTEMRIVQKVLNKALDDLNEAWKPVYDVQFSYLSSEVNPQFANIISQADMVVVSHFQVELEGGMGDLHVVLPYAMIEPIRENLMLNADNGTGATDERWSDGIRHGVNTTTVVLETILTEFELTVRELLTLQPGDIIPVELTEEVVAQVDGSPVFKAKYGISKGNYALKVTELTEPNNLQLMVGTRK